MDKLIQELIEIQEELNDFITKATTTEVTAPLNAIESSAQAVGKAWSGSWLGYHANVYFKDLQPPPTGEHFSSDWGLMYATGDDGWLECDPDEVKNKISELASYPDITPAIELAKVGTELFDQKRDQAVSILEVSKLQYGDSFTNDLLTQAKQLHITSEREIIANNAPRNYVTRDQTALSQGTWIPPHAAMLMQIALLRNPIEVNKVLNKIVEKSAAHLQRITKMASKNTARGNRVFIGHGRSHLWKDLQYFLQNRLKLEHDEFNRIPTAGKTNIERLTEMLDTSSIAFLILTAEDEQLDGTVRARMNVIHETGLFQGRLGFEKAIVLLEEGCEEFSNIQGLVQIRFPKGNIEAVFEKIRAVIEREGILPSIS